MSLVIIVSAVVATLVSTAIGIFVIRRTYVARGDRTYMTEADEGFKRALRGSTTLWDMGENVVRGVTAPNLTFVARDPATGGRKEVGLLDPESGAVNLRVQSCAPRPFLAMTQDSHQFFIEAQINFQLDHDRLNHTYHVQDFSAALESRVQTAFRGEIGKLKDEELRLRQSEVQEAVTQILQAMEDETDAGGPAGMPLGVKIYDASFTYVEFSPESPAPSMEVALIGDANGEVKRLSPPAGPPGAAPQAAAAGLAAAAPGGQGALSLRPQDIDRIADVFIDREPESIAAIMAMMEMQTRQNIAEALARSGNLVVVTGEEIGLSGGAAQREKLQALLKEAAAPDSAESTSGRAIPELGPKRGAQNDGETAAEDGEG